MENPSPTHPPNPWWIPPHLLGRVPPIDARHLSLLGFISLAMLFENYDFQILNAALKHIGEDLGIADADLGYFAGAIRFSGALGFLLIPLGDWIGRRRLFLISVVGFSVGTVLTAFSQSPLQFVLFQVISRTFMVAGAAVTYVILTEEFPAAYRGWGIGMLGAVASMGHGLAAGLFAPIEYLPFGWRSLYVLGFVPLLLLPTFRRNIPETRRFTEHAEARRLEQEAAPLTARNGALEAIRAWLAPLRSLAGHYPVRTLGVTLMGLLASVSHASVFFFTAFFVQEFHGWEPWQYSVIFVVGGLVGIVGNVVAGRLGDAYGRRPIAVIFLASFPALAWLFYTGPSWSLPFSWILLVFGVMGGNVTIRAITTELFPTSYRGTATGWLFLMEAFGGGLGGTLVSLLTSGAAFSPWAAITVSCAAFGGAAAVLLFPETRGLELESISQEN